MRIFSGFTSVMAPLTFIVLVASTANAAIECRTAEVEDASMCQKVCDAIKAANGVPGHLSIFKFMNFENVTYNTPTNQKLWEQNKAGSYASPAKISSCKAEPSAKGCLITMCGLLPGIRDVKRGKTNLNLETKYTQPKPHVGPAGLLESDTAADRQGPSAIGTPVAPSGGISPAYSRGSR